MKTLTHHENISRYQLNFTWPRKKLRFNGGTFMRSPSEKTSHAVAKMQLFPDCCFYDAFRGWLGSARET